MHWNEIDNTLTATFAFTNFRAALAFVNRIGELCEARNHHADICIHDYNKVTVTTTTHDAGRTVTENDRELAAAIDALG